MDLLVDWLRPRVPSAPHRPAPTPAPVTHGDEGTSGPTRRALVGGGAALGLAAGVVATVVTGLLVWPLLGLVAGIGVGDVVAGGRR
jgi:hypothetical protein